MKCSSTLFLQRIAAALPFLYMADTCSSQASEVPLHYGAEMAPDRFEYKKELLIILHVLNGAGLLVSAFFRISESGTTLLCLFVNGKVAILLIILGLIGAVGISEGAASRFGKEGSES